ncbi:MAG: PD-(D/E)XK nuclease family protein, partial [Candidatus Hydrogenedentota bacterium]
MKTTVEIIQGNARSDRSDRIDALLLAAWGAARLVVPTERYARRRLMTLLDRAGLPGAIGRPIIDFQSFVTDLLRGTAFERRRVDALEQRLLLQAAVAKAREAGKLAGFEAVSATPGFARHVQSVIAQLKQSAIDPGEFEHRTAHRTHRTDRAVAAIYGAYQDLLVSGWAYDQQGMYWMADLLCREGRPGALGETRVLLFDAFDDFTPSELRVIEALRPHVERMVFGLNMIADSRAIDLYQIPARTLAALGERFALEVHTADERDPVDQISHVHAHLFSRETAPPAAALPANLTLLETRGPIHELETIARRIKTLIVDSGVAPAEIAVVSRRLEGISGPLERVFAEFGVPMTAPPRALSTAPFGRFVLALLNALQTWERESVLEVVTSNSLQGVLGDRSMHARHFPVLAKFAGTISGREDWRVRVARLLRRVRDGSGVEIRELIERIPDAVAATEALNDAVAHLMAVDRRLEAEAPLARFVSVLESELRGLCDEEDSDAVFRALAKLSRGLSSNASISRTDFLWLMHDAFESANAEEARADGGVVVLDLEAARNVPFRHVFLVHANEGVLPSAESANAVYSAQDRSALAGAGVPFDDAAMRAARELLLFHHVFGTALEGLTISWHALGADHRPAGRSPFLEDVLRALGGEARVLEAQELIVPVEEAACRREWRSALLVSPGARADDEDAVCAHAGGAAEIERRRASAAAPDEYDGVLSGSAAAAAIAGEFGEAHVFSASQVQTYIECPFRFFAERVLRVWRIDQPEEAFDRRVRGSIVHGILEQFHRHYAGVSPSELPTPEAEETLAGIVANVFESEGWKSTNSPTGVVEVERLRMQACLARYLQLARANDGEWRPSHFEVTFGQEG